MKKLKNPNASASGINPKKLTLPKTQIITKTLIWYLTEGILIIGSIFLIALPFYKLRKQNKYLKNENKEIKNNKEMTKNNNDLSIISGWDNIALDGRKFAELGCDELYWFKVPLGGICFEEGFKSFLQPALDNPKVTKIRFVLDNSIEGLQEIWNDYVIRLIEKWANKSERSFRKISIKDKGKYIENTTNPTSIEWIFTDLSDELTPSFKLFLDDPNTIEVPKSQAQIFVKMTERKIALKNDIRSVSIPNTIIRINEEDKSGIFNSLSEITCKWDSIFEGIDNSL